jgi:hypothetical protein
MDIDHGNEPDCHRELGARGSGWVWQRSEPNARGRIKFDACDNTFTGTDDLGLPDERSHGGMAQP